MNIDATLKGTISLLLVGAVLVSSCHLKDMFGSSLGAVQQEFKKMEVSKDSVDHHGDHRGFFGKVIGELHTHIDKQVVKNPTHDNPLADHRSLRILQDNKKHLARTNFGNKLLDLWRITYPMWMF